MAVCSKDHLHLLWSGQHEAGGMFRRRALEELCSLPHKFWHSSHVVLLDSLLESKPGSFAWTIEQPNTDRGPHEPRQVCTLEIVVWQSTAVRLT